MTRILALLTSLLLALEPASAAVVQITVKDAGGTTRNMNVTTNTDLTGNLDFNQVICDQAAGTTCASVGTAGSPSTNALTVQAVTLGHGTAANAMRVELPTDGTGIVGLAAGTNAIGTVSVPTWAGGTLGAMANYGTSPGAVLVPGVNAFITNVPTVAQATAANLNATIVGTGTLATQVNGFTSWAGGTLGAMANYGTSPGAVLVPGVNAFVTNTLAAIVPADNVANPAAGGSPVESFGALWDSAGTQWVRAPGTAAGGAKTNLGQVNGVTVLTGTGATGTGAQRVAVAVDSATVAGSATLPAGTNSIGSVNLAANVTATACSATVVTGGTAVNAFTAQTTLHGFTIANIDTTEPMWVSFTGTAAASGTDSYPLPAATATTFAGFGSFTAPPGFGLNHALSVVAATNGHKFSCTWW